MTGVLSSVFSCETALAIVRGMSENGWDMTKTEPLVERAVNLLLQIRPKARPNVLFLRLCLEQFLDPAKARELTVRLVNHPTLMENRFVRPREVAQECGPYRQGD